MANLISWGVTLKVQPDQHWRLQRHQLEMLREEEHRVRVIIKDVVSLTFTMVASVAGIVVQARMADQKVKLGQKFVRILLLVTSLATLFLGLLPLVCGIMLRNNPRRLCMMNTLVNVAVGFAFLTLLLMVVFAFV